MNISLFDYHLPKELIAQEPIEPRDHSRLLILNRKTRVIEHKHFYNIIDYLSDNDVLVFNDSKVVPGRLYGKKANTQHKAEILLIRPENKQVFDFVSWPQRWVIIGKPGLKEGQKIKFTSNLSGTIEKKLNYERIICFNQQGEELKREILSLGQVPLPPYITKLNRRSFKEYQTVYAKKLGSVAAPTAGFHFTQNLLNKIKEKKIQLEFITLYVGLGTFLPVKVQNIEDHQMYSEFFELNQKTASRLNQAKKEGKRIIAVGTTVVRVLETCAHNSKIEPKQEWTNLFIYPGYKFKFVDALITNFHLPKSTLLMLVSAFATRDLILKAYEEAIARKYRFFSFGDAMFII
ncbi:MAG: tRNA preQ1(34) S-adenosylmethionine ribosyltransferase-isomerase QueA [Candidatus Pacebacteria bacterium]|nr:tRNA preQ1(34) S-adenosylmethionine ribosyltransferase-isomerase QueA [Candidatus Paceibacterota bacterium]